MDYIQDRKLKIRILQLAAQHGVRRQYYICDSLDLVSRIFVPDGHLEGKRAIQELKAYVTAAISPAQTYGLWLHRHYEGIYLARCRYGFVRGRIAWINWMIACYEEDIANYKETHG